MQSKLIAPQDISGLLNECLIKNKIIIHNAKNNDILSNKLSFKYDSIGGKLVSGICFPILDAMKNNVGCLQLLQNSTINYNDNVNTVDNNNNVDNNDNNNNSNNKNSNNNSNSNNSNSNNNNNIIILKL